MVGRVAASGVTLPVVVCLALLASSCGSAPTPIVRHPDGCEVTTPKPGHHLEIYLSAKDSTGKIHPLCPGQALHPAQALHVEVETDRDAHMHLAFIDPAGDAGVLALTEGDGETRSAHFLAPPNLLTPQLGEALLFLVASEKPLEKADFPLHALFDAIRETGIQVDSRGVVRRPSNKQNPGRSLHFDAQIETHADFNTDGVAALVLALRIER